ncbi:MAG: hypothetical protein CL928_19185 [Deltaproteobacteria bacterium]|nr:hypothetical protein [Deltaproteobacteria bacterium]
MPNASLMWVAVPTTMTQATMTQATMTQATMTQATMTQATMTQATMTQATMTRRRTDLAGTIRCPSSSTWTTTAEWTTSSPRTRTWM